MESRNQPTTELFVDYSLGQDMYEKSVATLTVLYILVAWRRAGSFLSLFHERVVAAPRRAGRFLARARFARAFTLETHVADREVDTASRSATSVVVPHGGLYAPAASSPPR